jgi:DHA2 family multidrug resistance protein
MGFAALSLWLGCQEIFLDKGQEEDWLSSRFIQAMAVLAVTGFIVFIYRELKAEKPMVELRIFRVRNFAMGTILIFLTSLLIYAIALLTPQFLQQLMGYSSFAAGIAVSPLGLGAVISMVLVGKLVSKIDPRHIIAFGFLVSGFAAFCLSRISLDMAPWTVFWPQLLAGSAMGFLFVPINVAGTAPLRRDQIGSATGTLNLMRNVGGSVGIALVSTFLARRSQIHQNVMVQHLTMGSPLLLQRLHGIQAFMCLRVPSSGDGTVPAFATLYRILQQQAALLAFMDVYEGLMVLAVGAALLAYFMRKGKTGADQA